MLEFTELKWSQKNLRGQEPGTRGNAFVYIPGRKACIHIRTGSTSENDVRLVCGASIIGFGPKTDFIFSEVPDARTDEPTRINPASMYMSQDGSDPWAGKRSAHPGIPPREPRENAAMKPNTDYYLTMRVLDKGHDSWVPQMRLTYYATDNPDDYQLTGDVSGGLEMVISGVPGRWMPDL